MSPQDLLVCSSTIRVIPEIGAIFDEARVLLTHYTPARAIYP
jgi:hypothetical protein